VSSRFDRQGRRYITIDGLTVPQLGYIDMDIFSASLVPANWALSIEDTGQARLTHSLNLSSPELLLVVVQIVGPTAADCLEPIVVPAVDYFDIFIKHEDGTPANEKFWFRAEQIQL
jgi:hypothetical protein